MASLGGMLPVAGAVPGKEGLPEAGARGDQGDCAFRGRFARAQPMQLRGFQEGHGAGRRRQVVQEGHRPEPEGPPDLLGIGDPGEVGQQRPAGDNRPGNGQTDPLRGKGATFEELADQGLDPAEVDRSGGSPPQAAPGDPPRPQRPPGGFSSRRCRPPAACSFLTGSRQLRPGATRGSRGFRPRRAGRGSPASHRGGASGSPARSPRSTPRGS